MDRRRRRRLALYLARALAADGNVTSDELAEAAGTEPSQARRDLAALEGLSGTRGVGYESAALRERLLTEFRASAQELAEEARLLNGQAELMARVSNELAAKEAR